MSSPHCPLIDNGLYVLMLTNMSLIPKSHDAIMHNAFYHVMSCRHSDQQLVLCLKSYSYPFNHHIINYVQQRSIRRMNHAFPKVSYKPFPLHQHSTSRILSFLEFTNTIECCLSFDSISARNFAESPYMLKEVKPTITPTSYPPLLVNKLRDTKILHNS